MHVCYLDGPCCGARPPVSPQHADKAEARTSQLIERAGTRSRLLRGQLVSLCLRRTRQLAGVRELAKFFIVMVNAEMRRQVRGVGAIWSPADEATRRLRAGHSIAVDGPPELSRGATRMLRCGRLKARQPLSFHGTRMTKPAAGTVTLIANPFRAWAATGDPI